MGKDGGWKTLTEASDKPKKIAGKLQKKVQVIGSDMFLVQVVGLGQKSASSGLGHTFLAGKCDL